MDDLTAALAADLDVAFPRLVDAHADRLYTIAFRVVGSAPDAEELASDALVRAYRAMTGYDPQRIRSMDLRAWLTTIVVNLSRNRLRRRRPDLSFEAAGDAASRRAAAGGAGSVGREPDPATVALDRERAGRLAAALADLPIRYRIPVVLRHIDECSYAEMSAVLGRPEGTLKAQVHRGLALLRATLEAPDADPPNALPASRQED